MNLAIVTGGSRGLGCAITNLLTAQHWTVFELSRSGTSKQSVNCDLSDLDSVWRIANSLFGTLSLDSWDRVVFINNAAELLPIKSVSSLSSAEIARSLTINQGSAFTLISEFTGAFRENNITKIIVNISSGAALKGYAGWSLYCASKAANDNFIKTIAAEEDHQEFPFFAINYEPGVIDTDMQSSIREADEAHFPDKEKFIEYKNSGKLRTADSVASHLVRLLSGDVEAGHRYRVQD